MIPRGESGEQTFVGRRVFHLTRRNLQDASILFKLDKLVFSSRISRCLHCSHPHDFLLSPCL